MASSSSAASPQWFPNGSISELFHFPTAAVMLLDYDVEKTVRLLGLGQFHIKLVVQRAEPPLLTTYCSVDGFQWPMAKDAPVIRICSRTFVFGLPGLLYALQLPSVCPDMLVDSLERVFMKFGHYQNFGDPASGGPGYACADNEPGIWSIVRPLAEPKAHAVLVLFGHEPLRIVTVLPHMISCFTRATKMSAATKAIVNGQVSGTLRRIHVTVAVTDESYCTCDDGDNGGDGSLRSMTTMIMLASSSISVFTCLVDAIEAAWMYSMGVPRAVLDLDPYLRNDYGYPGFKVWRLNRTGLTAFVQGLESAAEREQQMVTLKTEIGYGDGEGKGKQLGSAKAATSSDASAKAKRKRTKH